MDNRESSAGCQRVRHSFHRINKAHQESQNRQRASDCAGVSKRLSNGFSYPLLASRVGMGRVGLERTVRQHIADDVANVRYAHFFSDDVVVFRRRQD